MDNNIQQSIEAAAMPTNAVVSFIRNHPTDWETRLSDPPYNLRIKSKPDRDLFIFSYDQIRSDFNLLEVQHARGLILQVIQTPAIPDLGIPESVTCTVRCYPFDKFFNYGEVTLQRLTKLPLGEVDEVLAYFPEFRSEFDVITLKYNKLLVSISAACAAALGYKHRGLTKKEFASIVLAEKPELRPYMFATWDGKDIQPYLDKIDIDAVESFYEEA